MNNNLKNILIIFVILSILTSIKIILDNKYYTSSTLLFNDSIDDISKFEIYNTIDTIMIVRTDNSWKIIDYDTLEIIENKINDFSNQVLKVEKETLISSNIDNWEIYSVDDSTGMHLILYNQNNKLLGHYVFGRSKRDWSHNYVRTYADSDVYLTSENCLRYLNTNQNFWGSIPPKPIEALNDQPSEIPDTSKAE